MADDIVMMLRSVLDPEMPLSERAAIEAAIAEIERLRAALAIARDALASAEAVIETLLKEARRG